MSDIELGISTAKKIEAALGKKFNATGKGLHEKTSSVESKLSPALVRKIRFIATVRNKLAHDVDFKRIDDRPRFKQAAKEILQELNPPAFSRKAILIGSYLAIKLLK